jgi:hypothetical protein
MSVATCQICQATIIGPLAFDHSNIVNWCRTCFVERYHLIKDFLTYDDDGFSSRHGFAWWSRNATTWWSIQPLCCSQCGRLHL